MSNIVWKVTCKYEPANVEHYILSDSLENLFALLREDSVPHNILAVSFLSHIYEPTPKNI